MFWFDKSDDRALFNDIRREEHTLCDGRELIINPDYLSSFVNMPFNDEQFNIVVFDPPHLKNAGDNSWLVKKYGKLTGDWKEDLKKGFTECFRVLKTDGTLIFKWNEDQVKVSEILALTDEKPLFGHRSGKASNTHWICFIKGGN
jgi:23S rRNA G2069 N7-methylase RlmK/C1962 C5-methylase RlmI